MNRYNLLTQKVSGEKILNRVIEDDSGDIFIDYAGNWCFSFMLPKQRIFIIKDIRTGNWVKRPILALEKISTIQKRRFELSKYIDFSKIETFEERIQKSESKLAKSISKEIKLQRYIENIIKENGISLIVERNGLSGKNTYHKGDLLLFNSIHPNRKPIATIEYLSRIQNKNSIRLNQKDVYEDYRDTIRHRIKYIIAYQKTEGCYGFVRIAKSNFRTILFKNFSKNQKRTSISISKLSKYELPIIPFLRSISKRKGLETRESITEYQIKAYSGI